MLKMSIETEDCVVLQLFDESGEGTMTAHKIFDGAFVMYSDMHLKECTSYFQSSTVQFASLYRPLQGGTDRKARLAIMRIAICKSMRCVWMTGVPIRDGSAFHSATIMG